MNDVLVLTEERIEQFCADLLRQERSAGTVSQYRRNLMGLFCFLGESRRLERELLLEWKQELTDQKAISTVNGAIAAVNAFLDFAGVGHLKLKSLRCQRRSFSEEGLTREELQALIEEAKRVGDEQAAILLRVMAGSGVRVSEVKFLTVEAAREKMAVIRLKGKTRFVPLAERVCDWLLSFAAGKNIQSGPVFCGKSGKPLDRRRIWERMKKLCVGAGVDPKKVHPHALRHLFARLFYDITHDIAKLADLLGHGSIETTRIYIMTSCNEHRAILDLLTSRLGAKKPPQRDGKRPRRT